MRPSARELEAMYEHLGGVTAVAREIGVSFETARRWLVDAGIELRSKGRPSVRAQELNTDELKRRYLAGESIAQLGRANNVSPATVRSRLVRAGVKLRPRPGWKY